MRTDDPDALLAIIAGRDTRTLFEVRCRDPRSGRITARDWYHVGDIDGARSFILSHAERLDVYVGTAPRTAREGGKAHIARGWCLWADIDTADGVARLRRFSPSPSLVIRSGSGENVHAYWALTEALPPAWLERANRRLAFALGADMKATDAARILRPPGTLNHKHDPPRRVAIEHVWKDPRLVRVSVASVVKNFPDPPSKPPSRRAPRPDVYTDDPLLGVSSDRYYAVLTGREVTRGNVCCPFPAHRGGGEKSPSMRLYDGGTFNCFGCSVGGSIIQFAAHLWGYPDARGDNFREIRERLTRELL